MNSRIDIEHLPNRVPLKMIKVEGGSFMMGSEKGDEDEKPVHQVDVPSFYIGQYSITNEQFLPFLNERGNQEEGGEKWVNVGNSFRGAKCGIEKTSNGFKCVEGLEKHPMVYVSWDGAVAYCKWLSEKTERNYRLLSEAEWEYAARGGKSSKGYKYSGSNNLKEVGWFNQNSHIETKEVGLKKANELGLYDMSGNVYEWCADHWHDNYEGAPKDGSSWSNNKDETSRMIRGGSWFLNDLSCRVSFRDFRNLYNRFIIVGFRIARY